MSTFHEMMNTVKFRGVVGWAHREADLWPLRDLLFELQSDVQNLGALSALKLKQAGLDVEAALGGTHVQLIATMIEQDIVTIEAYCRSRGISR